LLVPFAKPPHTREAECMSIVVSDDQSVYPAFAAVRTAKRVRMEIKPSSPRKGLASIENDKQ
jgi:hypothetical protein